jgi:tripartite-type tricarboxylate transporter receptor subunit TctC
MNCNRRSALATLGAALASTAWPASAQSYPERVIRFVVGYPPGNSVDQGARVFAIAMARELGQSIVVDNKVGANGILGAQEVKSAKPDGYTMLFGASGQLAINPTLYKKLPYDPLKDFAAIGITGKTPMLVLANPSFGANNLVELIAMAKAQPGKINFGSGGLGATAHLSMELIAEAAHIKVTHIPYKGTPDAMNNLIGGQIPLMVDVLPSALPNVKSGRVKALAVTSKQRHPLLPDVPTVAEQGFKDFETAAWSGLVAPRGTPAPIVARLSAAWIKAGQAPEVRQMLDAVAMEFIPLDPAQTQAFMEAELRKWARAVHQAGVQMD